MSAVSSLSGTECVTYRSGSGDDAGLLVLDHKRFAPPALLSPGHCSGEGQLSCHMDSPAALWGGPCEGKRRPPINNQDQLASHAVSRLHKDLLR